MDRLIKVIFIKVICMEGVYGNLDKETYMKATIIWTKSMDTAFTDGRTVPHTKECSKMAINYMMLVKRSLKGIENKIKVNFKNKLFAFFSFN